jgi:hypothetical protein
MIRLRARWNGKHLGKGVVPCNAKMRDCKAWPRLLRESHFRNCENVKVSTRAKGSRDCKFRRSNAELLREFVIEDRGGKETPLF